MSSDPETIVTMVIMIFIDMMMMMTMIDVMFNSSCPSPQQATQAAVLRTARCTQVAELHLDMIIEKYGILSHI